MPLLTVVVEQPDGGDPAIFREVQQTNKEPLGDGRVRLGKKIGVKKSAWGSYEPRFGGPDGAPIAWDAKTGDVGLVAGSVLYLKYVGPPGGVKKRGKKAADSDSASSFSADAAPDADVAALHEGELIKRGHKRKNWKRRWFALHARALVYSAKRGDAKPKGVIRLDGARVDPAPTGLAKPREHLFALISRAGVTTFMAAASADERQTWLGRLEAALASAASATAHADAHADADTSIGTIATASTAGDAMGSAGHAGPSSGAEPACVTGVAGEPALAAAAASSAATSVSCDSDDGSDPYAIGAVLDVRVVRKQVQYLVRFKHLGPEADTWETAENLEGIDELIAAFHASQDAEDKRKRASAQTMTIADWDLLGVLGEGGYGRVELCRLRADPNPNALFAIKILNKAFLLDKGEVEHTRTEAQVLQSVKHPFLVSMHYAFQSASELYFVMDYVDGGDLVKFWRAAGGQFPEARALFYAAEVLLALDALHALGIIHRDLKMENLLLDSGGHVLLTDFGLAKSNMTDGSTTRTLCGTFACLAPEVVENEAYGKPVDLWGFAVTLFQMVVGSLPFPAEDRMELFSQILECRVVYPDWLSPELTDLFARLFRRAPAERLTAESARAHVAFIDVDWTALLERRVTPPYLPPTGNQTREERARARVGTVAAGPAPLSDVEQRMFRGFSYAPADFARLGWTPEKMAALEQATSHSPSPTATP